MIIKGILGTKGATEQIFTPAGERIPVTHISTSPCYVVDVKTVEKHGYWAIQIAFSTAKNMKNPQRGIIKKAGLEAPLRFLKEIRFDSAEVVENNGVQGLKIGSLELFPGQELVSSDLFAEGDMVTVTGTSKGKGFQGVVRRHGFHGGNRTHGQSDRERAPGSIGSGTTLGRVFKGLKMAGRMGGDTVTVKNLEVISVDADGLRLKGVIPGSKGGMLVLRSASAVPAKKVEVVESTDVTETEEVTQA